MIQTFIPKNWKDYALLDCGDFEKLEQFGRYILRRPEPQAVWSKRWSEDEWKSRTNAEFKSQSSHKGDWIVPSGFQEPWRLQYPLHGHNLVFNLKLTSFKHVGIFPEQADNWDFIQKKVKDLKQAVGVPKVLNLFAYTGGASLAARSAGADVTHVDSVRQVIAWAGDNQQSSGLKDIRWVVEDAMKFAEREARRGNLYNGIILDPPAYGIGAKGERWKLEDMIDTLLKTLSKILHPQHRFLILNSYSLGFSSLIVRNLLENNFQNIKNIESGELTLMSKTGLYLPLGVIGRIS